LPKAAASFPLFGRKVSKNVYFIHQIVKKRIGKRNGAQNGSYVYVYICVCMFISVYDLVPRLDPHAVGDVIARMDDHPFARLKPA